MSQAHPKSFRSLYLLIVLLFTVAAFAAEKPKFQPAANVAPANERYIVMLSSVVADVDATAAEMAQRYHGRILTVWKHAVRGFWIEMNPTDAPRLARDRRVGAMQLDTKVSLSMQPMEPTTKVTIPGGPYPNAEDPLWHLTRITHRTNDTSDKVYRAGHDGTDARVYLIDSGVWTKHREFQPSAATTTLRAFSGSRITAGLNPAGIPYPNPLRLLVPGPNPVPVEIVPEPAVAETIAANNPCGHTDDPDEDAGGAIAYHGTATASMIVGRYVGVATGATLVPVKAIPCDGQGTIAMLINAFEMVKAHHAGSSVPAVVSISTYRQVEDAVVWNGSAFVLVDAYTSDIARPELDVLEHAINNVIDAGIPVVASANNHDGDACYTTPARLSRRSGRKTLGGDRTRLITVGGTDPSDKRWRRTGTEQGEPGSNYGQCVDIWAPAKMLTVATPSDDGTNIYTPPAAQSGTSFAAPQVAGVIARMFAEDPSLAANPYTTADRVWERLAANATLLDPQTANLGPGSPKELLHLAGVTFTAPLLDARSTQPVELKAPVFRRTGKRYHYRWTHEGNQVATAIVDSSSDYPDQPIADSPYAATTTGTYQVRVTECDAAPAACGDQQTEYWAESRAVTVTIATDACILPAMAVQPVSQFVVGAGTATLEATVSNAANHWWELYKIFPGNEEKIDDGVLGESGSVSYAVTADPVESVRTYQFRFCASTPCTTPCTLFSETAQIRSCTSVPAFTITQGADLAGPTLSTSVDLDGRKIQWLYRRTSNDPWKPLRLDFLPREARNPAWRTYGTTSLAPYTSGQYAALLSNGCSQQLSNVEEVGMVCRVFDLTQATTAAGSRKPGGTRQIAGGTSATLIMQPSPPLLTPRDFIPGYQYEWCTRTATGLQCLTPTPDQTFDTPVIAAGETKEFVVNVTDGDGRTDCRRSFEYQISAPSASTCFSVTRKIKLTDDAEPVLTETTLHRVPKNAQPTLEVVATPPGTTYTYAWRIDGSPVVPMPTTSWKTPAITTTTTVTILVTDTAKPQCPQAQVTFILVPETAESCSTFSLEDGFCSLNQHPTLSLAPERHVVFRPVIMGPGGNLPADSAVFDRWLFDWKLDGTPVHYGLGIGYSQYGRTFDGAAHTITVTVTNPDGCAKTLSYKVLASAAPPCTANCSAPIKCRRRAAHSPGNGTTILFTPGEEVTISIDDTTGVTAYEWHRLMGGIDTILGTTSTIDVTLVEAAEYYALVTIDGEITESERFIAIPAAARSSEVTVAPATVSVRAGGDFTLTASFARANGSTRYEWRRADTYDLSDPIIGTSSELSVRNLADNNKFWCRVIEVLGDGSEVDYNSNFATVTVECTPTVGGHIVPHPPFVAAGYPSLLGAAPHGKGVSLAWYRLTPDGQRVPISYGGAVNVYPTAAETRYGAVGTDDCGQTGDLNEATVYVCVPTITEQPQSLTIIRGGTTATLTAAADPAIPGQAIDQTWHEADDQYYQVPLDFDGSFTTPPIPAGTTKMYRSVFKAACTGSVTYSHKSEIAVVQACSDPVISVGSSVLFSAYPGMDVGVGINVTGTELTYQWYRGESGDISNPLDGKTETGMFVYPQTETRYWCRVTSQGVCTSDSPTITVRICPQIVDQPVATHSVVMPGTTTSISINATGDDLRYQWYTGQRGVLTSKIEGATGATLFTPPITGTTTFWCRVTSGEEGCYRDSEEVTVALCSEPTVRWVSNSQSVGKGDSVQLILDADYTTVDEPQITVYSGPAGDLANSTVFVPNVSFQYFNRNYDQTTTLWARATSGNCWADTGNLTITVCIPKIATQPTGAGIVAGSSHTMTVTSDIAATSFQWYAGQPGDISNPVGALLPAGTSASITVSPTATTPYWVRVKGCGTSEVDSAAAVVTVCTPATIASQSAVTQAIVKGATRELYVEGAGTDISYRWYRGVKGDTTNQIGNASSVFVTPTDTTKYWARVSNSCGSTDGETITVNVCATPVITAQPASQKIFSGATATLSVTATQETSTPMTYQWYRGTGTANPVGTNSASFTTPALTADTVYWVRVSAGNCNVDSAAATVSMCAYNPTLNAPDDKDIAIGQTVRLSATVSPVPQQVRWYRGAQGDRTNVISNISYADVSPTVTTEYWGEFTHDGCTMMSRTVTVYVSVPTITTQPLTQQVNPNTSVRLTVAANTTGLSYQWYSGSSGSGTVLSGQTNSYFDTPALAAGTVATYWVKVTGSRGHAVNSDTATITVCSPASISTEPANRSIRRGETTTLSVTAAGTNLRYQWYRATAPSETNAAGTTASINVAPTDPTNYWVKVTSDCGTKNSVTAKVDVCIDPTMTGPASQTIYSGTTATLTVSATAGTALPLSYQWYSGTSGSGTVITGATSASYTTPALTNGASYWVKVTSGACSVNSSTATVSICGYAATVNAPDDKDIALGETVRLSVNLSPVPASGRWFRGAQGVMTNPISSYTFADVSPTENTEYWGEFTHNGCTTKTRTVKVWVSIPAISTHPLSQQPNPNTSVRLTVAANIPGVSYQWYSGTSGSGTLLTGQTNSYFDTPAHAAGTVATYWAKVTGPRGHAVNSNTATVTWCTPASITQQPMARSIRQGYNGSLTVSATGTNLRYQWYRATSPNQVNPVGNGTSQLEMAPTDSYDYWVKVTSDCGVANSNTARVDVCVDPAINTQPASPTINTGSTATLTVAATAGTNLGLTYQWYSGTSGNGTAIAGETNATFTTPPLTSAANYWVKVTSGVCSTNSSTATVSICPYPATVNAPADKYARAGVATLLSISLNPAPQTWKWYRGVQGDRSVPLSTQPSFNVYPTVTTKYWGEFTYNGCTTWSRTITVNVCIPTITEQPAASQTVGYGSPATLSVTATEAVSYQWYRGTYPNLIPGATGSTYTIPAVWESDYFWVDITGACGNPVRSDYAEVTVN